MSRELNDIPTTKVRVCLKQIDTESSNISQKLALEFACPLFSERYLNDTALDFLRNVINTDHGNIEQKEVWFTSLPQRRFSGGTDLPRSRYFSVCPDPTSYSIGRGDITLLTE